MILEELQCICCLIGNFCFVTVLVIESEAMRWSRQMIQHGREQVWQPCISEEREELRRGFVLIRILPKLGVRLSAVRGDDGKILLILFDFLRMSAFSSCNFLTLAI